MNKPEFFDKIMTSVPFLYCCHWNVQWHELDNTINNKYLTVSLFSNSLTGIVSKLVRRVDGLYFQPENK